MTTVLICLGIALLIGSAGGGAAGLVAAIFSQPGLAVGVGAVFAGGEDEKPAALLPFTSEARAIAVTSDGQKIIVSDSFHNTVAIIDNQTRKVTSVLDAMGTNPLSVTVTPDNKRAYVANFGRDSENDSTDVPGNTVSVFDLDNEQFVTTIEVGKNPYAVAITPDGKKAYVTNSFFDPVKPNDPATVSVIDIATNSVTQTIQLSQGGTVGQKPTAIATTTSGDKIFVVNRQNAGSQNGSVSIIDTNTDSVIQMIVTGENSVGIAIDPSDATVYVSNKGDDTVTAIDVSGDPATVLSQLNVGNGPGPLIVDPDGKRVYVANLFDSFGDLTCPTDVDPADGAGVGKTVSVIDAGTNTVIPGEIEVGLGPLGLVITGDSNVEDSSKIYVISACDATVSKFRSNQISNNANIAADSISVAARASAVTISDEKEEVYVAHPHAVSVIDTAIDSVLGNPISIRGAGPIQLASSAAAGSPFKIYGIHPGLNSMSIVDVNGNSETVAAPLGLGGRPSSITYSEAQSKLIITLSGFSKTTLNSETLDNRIALIEVKPVGQSDTLLSPTLDVGKGPLKSIRVNDNSYFIAAFGHFIPVNREPSGSIHHLEFDINGTPSATFVTNTDSRLITDIAYKAVPDNLLYVADFGFQQQGAIISYDVTSLLQVNERGADSPAEIDYTSNEIYTVNYAVQNGNTELIRYSEALVEQATIVIPDVNPIGLEIRPENTDFYAYILHAGDRSYICDQNNNTLCEIGSTLSVVNLQNDEFERIEVGSRPTDVAFATVNARDLILVSSYFENTVTIIDRASIDFDAVPDVIKQSEDVGSGPADILIIDDRAYVANSISNDISVIQLSDNLDDIAVVSTIVLQ